MTDPANHTIQSMYHGVMPPSGASLAVRYALFGMIGTAINVAVQVLVSVFYYGPFQFWIALICGTAAGISPKYLLDKRWIFADPSGGIIRHARDFTLYTLTAVVTTSLFWATEFGFDRLGGGKDWRYVGAVIGLAAGYLTKYHLDRRYVFSADR